MIVLRVALALVILPCLGGAQKLYSALGLNKDASLSEIKSAYRKLSKEYHPDSAQNAGNAKIKKKYIKIQKAYEVLKDAEKRKEYDETGDLKEGMKEKQEKDHYKFTNLFEDDNDLTEFDGDLDAKLHGEEPWLVFFWSRQAPASMESGNDFKRVAAEYRGVFRSTQVPCDMYNACHQVGGVGLPSMALVHKSSLRWVTGDVNHFSMSEFVKSVLESAVIGRILDVHKLTPESFPLTVPFEFVIFQVSECVDCQAELNVALARYYVMSHSSYRHWMPAIRVATIDCSAYKKLCSMYGVEAYYDEEDEEQFRDLPFSAPRQPWRVAAINPHAHSVRIEGSFFEYEKINGHNVVWLIPKAYSPSQTIETANLKHSHYLDFALRQFPTNIFRFTSSEQYYHKISQANDAFVVAFIPFGFADGFDFVNELELLCKLLLNHRGATGYAIQFGVVDCSVVSALCNDYPIVLQSARPSLAVFPYLKASKAGDPFWYEGVWHVNSLFTALTREAEPNPLKTLTTEMPATIYTGNWMVLFTAGAWCPPCVAMKPVFSESARHLEKDDITVARIDCDKRKDFCNMMGITGYPTVKAYIHINGKQFVHTFNGARTPWHLAEFARTSLTSQVVTYGQDLIERSRSKDVLLVMFGAGQWCPPCNRAKQFWPYVSGQLSAEMEVGMIDCDNFRGLCNRFGIDGYPTFVLYGLDEKGERKITLYEGQHDWQMMVQWARASAK